MSFVIVDSSPQALHVAENGYERKTETKYPFDLLDVGKSFTIPLDQANVPSLRASAHRRSKGEKKFVVVVHEQMNPPCVEVARTL